MATKTIRIGTYNVNNLFSRANIMQLDGFSSDGAVVLADVATLDNLLDQPSYAGAVGTQIKALLEKYGFHEPKKNLWFTINEVRNRLYSVKQDGSGVTIVAKGRQSWVGWVQLVRDTVNAASTDNTARVIQAIKADVLCTAEVEDRFTLDHFNSNTLASFNSRFFHDMLVDGNDDRGIDVGILSNFEIRSVHSHIDDPLSDNSPNKVRIFSRDCAEYELILPSGKSLWVLCNHFKSKGFGTQAANDAKRTKQAKRVREILGKFDLAKDCVVVAGDLNDSPTSQPLTNLIATPNLFNVVDSLSGPKWTYQDAKDQIDYLLVSKALNDKLKKVGIERRGIYSATNFHGQFPHFPEVTDKATQASDHAAVWADFKV